MKSVNMPDGRIQLEIFTAYPDPGAFTIGMVLALCYNETNAVSILLNFSMNVDFVCLSDWFDVPRTSAHETLLIPAMQSYREGRFNKEIM